jgi:hypothetical protein
MNFRLQHHVDDDSGHGRQRTRRLRVTLKPACRTPA